MVESLNSTCPTQSATDAELVRRARELVDWPLRRDEVTDRLIARQRKMIAKLASRIEALSAEVAELELTSETARAQAKSALVLLEPLRASRREYGEKCWQAGWKTSSDEYDDYYGNDEAKKSELCAADLDALEREGE